MTGLIRINYLNGEERIIKNVADYYEKDGNYYIAQEGADTEEVSGEGIEQFSFVPEAPEHIPKSKKSTSKYGW